MGEGGRPLVGLVGWSVSFIPPRKQILDLVNSHFTMYSSRTQCSVPCMKVNLKSIFEGR